MQPSLTSFTARTCPDALSDADLAFYREHGFIAYEDVLSATEVAVAQDALADCTRRLLTAAREGTATVRTGDPDGKGHAQKTTIQDPTTGMGLQYEAGIDPVTAEPGVAERAFRKLYNYDQQHPAFQALVKHPRIQGFIAFFIGEDAMLKDTMALAKPARIGVAKPWHQDNAYFDWLPLELTGTVWIALHDATIENSCMQVIPGGQRHGAMKHWHDADCEIVPGRLDTSGALPVPLRAGGAMFFSGMIPHYTAPNTSDRDRNALQLQYRGVSTRIATPEEYGKVFAEADGTPATCHFGERA